MNNILDLFSNFLSEKKIKVKQKYFISILEESIRNIIEKKYGISKNYDIEINTEKGILDINIKSNSNSEKIGKVKNKILLSDFGRRSILFIKKNLIYKLNEYYNNVVYKNLKKKIGEIIHAEVYHILQNKIILKDENNNEMILPKKEQINNEVLKKGDYVFSLLKSVDIKYGKIISIISRSDIKFIEKLFELEITEISDKTISIKKIVRFPGKKTKISVLSYNDKIDPVGTCVGVKGSRINQIIKELKNETIDVINYTEDNKLYITRALFPSKISNIKIDDNKKIAYVYVKDEEISKLIGKNGTNIKLASKLTGFKIHILKYVSAYDEVEKLFIK